MRKDKAELKDALLQRQRHWFDDESSPEMIGNVGKNRGRRKNNDDGVGAL